MLYTVGAIVFDLANNLDKTRRTSAEDFARKDVVGMRRPYESVGEGDEKLTLSGELFPEKIGGEGLVRALISLKASATPQAVIRGDGMFLGYYVITSVSDDGEYLDPQGRARHVSFSVELEKCDPPSASGALSSLVNLFSGGRHR